MHNLLPIIVSLVLDLPKFQRSNTVYQNNVVHVAYIYIIILAVVKPVVNTTGVNPLSSAVVLYVPVQISPDAILSP